MEHATVTSQTPAASPWRLYDELIAGVPAGIPVRDYCLGTAWSYVEAACGMGVAWTHRGGAKQGTARDLRGSELRDVAQLAKSWNFEEATLGIAALNAWYARAELLDPLGAAYEPAEDPASETRNADDTRDNEPHRRARFRMDAFDQYRPRIASCDNAKVVVVGHFPRIDRIAEYAQLTVLERNCRDEWDTPDPACEYVIPEADFLFMTGVTLINKTAPRLLELGRAARAHIIMVGPSVVMTPRLFDYGVETLAGSIVADPDSVRFAVKSGAGKLFGSALQMCVLEAPDAHTTRKRTAGEA